MSSTSSIFLENPSSINHKLLIPVVSHTQFYFLFILKKKKKKKISKVTYDMVSFSLFSWFSLFIPSRPPTNWSFIQRGNDVVPIVIFHKSQFHFQPPPPNPHLRYGTSRIRAPRRWCIRFRRVKRRPPSRARFLFVSTTFVERASDGTNQVGFRAGPPVRTKMSRGSHLHIILNTYTWVRWW